MRGSTHHIWWGKRKEGGIVRIDTGVRQGEREHTSQASHVVGKEGGGWIPEDMYITTVHMPHPFFTCM